ncbi:hypothetical protein KUV62_16735 [Salipiger bermudensis]|uniref:hypothetical protein n=1 Tax=Salipiger bermudensis TaxID=344736 RepID=UPI001C9A27B6|nr:hypothetical protein [Salipiger bermudensis]MBY6005572.1 hypothetical protein [Salipiger bermudensis]
MPGPVLHLGATVTCSHGGQALPSAPFSRVLVSGQPVVTLASPYTVAGCGFAPTAGNGPCVSATVVSGSTRVFAGGTPLVLADSISICQPTGTPLLPVQIQTRVIAT